MQAQLGGINKSIEVDEEQLDGSEAQFNNQDSDEDDDIFKDLGNKNE